jgi:hypothetical protein
MANFKIIDGKKWELVHSGRLKDSKLTAKKRAQEYRKAGYNSRVIPYTHDYFGKKMTSYMIAIRKK